MPASPCRYPTPLRKYGDVSPCKNGVKPCAQLPECWGKFGGDVVKSMQCQQQYVRDLALYLFNTDKAFRNAWLDYVKVDDLIKLKASANVNPVNAPESSMWGSHNVAIYKKRLAEYNSATNVSKNVPGNEALKFAKEVLEYRIAGAPITSLNTVKPFRAQLLALLQKVFPALFAFKNGKIDFEVAPAGKGCADLSTYFTFIYNINILLDEGRTVRTGGTKKAKKAKKGTRRN